ncbi:MAG: GHKL domain-containing protein [Cyclobacteriaceae bacterium]
MSATTLWSQDSNFPSGFDPSYSLSEMIMDQWTNDNGLISSNLSSVYQSKSGYIWITSYNGLQCFDGHSFDSHTKLNAPFLSSNSFYRIFETNSDTLWLSTERSGMVGIHNNVLFPAKFNESIPRAVTSMHFSANGEIWIGTKNRGMFFQSVDGKVARKEDIPEVTINDIKEDASGTIWVATDGNGIYAVSDNRTEHYSRLTGLITDVVNRIKIHDNKIYMSSIGGVNVLVDDKLERLEAFDGLDINQLEIDDYNTIWVAAEQGVGRWNEALGIFELFTEELGLPARQVSSLVFDDEGSLWLTTKKAGMVRFRIGNVKTISEKNGLSSDKVNVISKHKGQIYIGTDNGEINLITNGEFSELVHDEQFQDAGIRDFLFDNGGNSWVANYNGLLKIEGRKTSLFNIQYRLSANEVRRIFQDSRGRIWIGTRTAGVIVFEDGKEDIFYNKSNGLKSNYILSIEEDGQGNIVVGTNAGGLSIIDKNEKFTTFHLKEDDSGILIFNTLIGSENEYLLCTNIGLYYFKNGSFQPLRIGETTDSNAYFDIVDDGIGSYWMTSNYGILKIEKSDIQKVVNGEKSDLPYKLFDENEGMLNQECTGATRSFFDAETGKIYVPTFGGVAVVDPKIKIENKKVPQVMVTGLETDDIKQDIHSDKINIEPGTFRYSIEFTSLSYLSPSNVHFKYKLDGIDDDWIGPVHERSVEYTNLPYGKYTFQVMGTNSDGVWNEQEASLSFEVAPFFYETLWFYLACTVLLAVILWVIYKWRIKEITERNLALAKINAELDRFVYSTSHDLRAPLASTMGLVNIVRMEESPEMKSKYIDLIEDCVNKMDNFISDIIDFSRNKNKEVNTEQFNIKDQVNEIFDNLKYLDHGNKVTTKLNIEGAEELHHDKLRIKVILSNLIANAIIYSKQDESEPEVKVTIRSDQSPLKITISDNGIGIKDSVKEKIFDMFYRANEQSKGSGLGLYIVKETIEKLNGSIGLISEEGKGSTFDISLP